MYKEKEMNRRQILASLNKIANELDNTGLYKEATSITGVMKRIAMDENDEYNMDDYGVCPDCGEPLDDGVCHDCGYGEDNDPKKKNNEPKKKDNISRLISKPPKSK